ncbi:MAG TPA: lipoyl synthase, partial [Thermodesulfovibrionia bacterium]|nr:lipoyl synthase [Thermodesulfovibrionia bacterium]
MRLPDWISADPLKGVRDVKKLLRQYGLSTVCEEARCPNQGRCFSKKTATFLILGDRCTRQCSFCAVTSSLPSPPDPEEANRVALAAKSLGLRYVVVTSVTRDDLPDGGASHFAETILSIRQAVEGVKVEVLVPDFQGQQSAVAAVVKALPDVFNHNVETVPGLYPSVRPQADYRRSLEVLRAAKEIDNQLATKSGIMVGLGERYEEVLEVMEELLNVYCDILTIGQYLRPGRQNIAVAEYIKPEIFEKYRAAGLQMGFKSVASSPLVRSSMDAE